MRKIINPGTINGSDCFIEIIYEDNKLSFVGIIGPHESECVASGQIEEMLDDLIPNDDWVSIDISRLKEIWKKHKVSSMVLGSPRQERFIKESGLENADFNTIVQALNTVDLLIDKKFIYDGKPYQYATGWIDMEVSEEDLNWLDELPETKIEPAWI